MKGNPDKCKKLTKGNKNTKLPASSQRNKMLFMMVTPVSSTYLVEKAERTMEL